MMAPRQIRARPAACVTTSLRLCDRITARIIVSLRCQSGHHPSASTKTPAANEAIRGCT